jgi:hypothetical protein
VKTLRNELDYEPIRAWALSPSAIRPPGLAQILCGGLIKWLATAQPLPTSSSARLRAPTLLGDSTPFSTLVAAMIAEVFA